MSSRKKIAPNRCLGWLESDGSVYILPGRARRAVEQMGGRLGISDSDLYAQLARLGMIASHDPGKYTKQISIQGQMVEVLHLTPEALGTEKGSSLWQKVRK